MNNKTMNKEQALKIAQNKFGLDATRQNSHYSKVNSRKNVWWIEVSMDKITNLRFSRLFFLLQQKDSISVLDIPTKFLRDSTNDFRVRGDNNKMCFEIDVVSFKDVIGPKKVNLKQFLLYLP